MSLGKTTERRKPMRKTISPNYLSPSLIELIDQSIGRLMGLSGLLSVESDSLTAAELLLQKSFWSKYSSPGLSQITGKMDSSPEERRSRAIEKWLKIEKRNESSNLRIQDRICEFGTFNSDDVLRLAARYIKEVIGSKPPRFLSGRFTGGASTRVQRGASAIASKYEGKAHVTETCLPYWVSKIFETGGWARDQFIENGYDLVSCSVLFTVPKNSEIDRVACKEPEVNMYMQRAAGDFIRKRMRRHGIDLNNQIPNQQLAYVGSRGRHYGTLDLSSASDTVSSTVVERLLPPDWFALLDALRVKQVLLPDGNVHTLHMFSSMGNGFTFELESLVFWTLTRAVSALIKCRGTIKVYGDDIVAPTATCLALGRVLPWFGFIVNEKKSFTSGPFRESCGKHYWNGSDVTPFYLREKITTTEQLIRLGNQLTAWCFRVPLGILCDQNILVLLSFIRAVVPACLHGGQSLERSDALVTGGTPRKRLVQVSKPVEISQSGGFLWWLDEKDKAPLQVLSPNEAAEVGRWVLRPNRSWYESGLMAETCHCLNPVVRQVDEVPLIT